MRILQFQYYDKADSWQLEPVEFGDLSLLVGVSGVGKTKTLRAISNVAEIAHGTSGNGVAWEIKFRTDDGVECDWQGEFENLGSARDISDYFKGSSHNIDKDEIQNDPPIIISESLFVDGQQIVRRNENEIVFRERPTLRLSPNESVISLLKQEDDIAPIHRSFRRIVIAKSLTGGKIVNFNKLAEKYCSLSEIQNSDLDTLLKLALLNRCESKVFEEIKSKFISIFPQVEDVKTEILASLSQEDVSLEVTQFPFFQVKEKNVDRWILPWELANGMLKSLGVISDLYLLPAGSVVLIDEIENSLGINCIDAIGDLLSAKRDIQMIVTSHHPYIINTIDMKHWKILTRRGAVVRIRGAKDFERLSKKSMHDNFTRLLEIDEIVQGVEE